MENTEDKIVKKVTKDMYIDLFDEVYTWLTNWGHTTTQSMFRGVYMYLGEIGMDNGRSGYNGISVTVPKGYGMLDYAVRVAKKFDLPYTEHNYKSTESITIYIKENAKAKKIPFMQSDRNFRKEWMKKHKNDRTAAWRKRGEENPLNALIGFEQ